MQFVLRNGSQVRFSHDKWCGNQSSKEKYPELYVIIVDKDASVNSHLEGTLILLSRLSVMLMIGSHVRFLHDKWCGN